LKTKIFCDIAELDQIKKFNKINLVKGFTTNPSLIRKAGARNYQLYCKKILKICNKKPISFEVFADAEKEMEIQALKINEWGKNIFVKIPVVNSKGHFMGKLINKLNKRGIKLNVTAIYKFHQTKMILKNLDKKTKTILSIFAGRMADAGHDPLPVFKKSIIASKNFKNVEILWASTREPYNYLQANQLGCHIITTPPNIIKKILDFGKTQNFLTVDTVRGFLSDSKKSKFNLK
jgi:transaldolase|tara:strand:+ start:99 stop:800 length:702 start_codon:yes stop_codon:yes gene_type:complete